MKSFKKSKWSHSLDQRNGPQKPVPKQPRALPPLWGLSARPCHPPSASPTRHLPHSMAVACSLGPFGGLCLVSRRGCGRACQSCSLLRAPSLERGWAPWALKSVSAERPGRVRGICTQRGDEAGFLGSALPFPKCRSLFLNLRSGVIRAGQGSVRMTSQTRAGDLTVTVRTHPTADGRHERAQPGTAWRAMSLRVHRRPRRSQGPPWLRTRGRSNGRSLCTRGCRRVCRTRRPRPRHPRHTCTLRLRARGLFIPQKVTGTLAPC